MMDQTGMTRIPYEEVMQALGYFFDQNSLREICIVELREGILVRGVKYSAERSGYQAISESFLFTHEDLERLVNENDERRQQMIAHAVAAAAQQGQRGGLFRR